MSLVVELRDVETGAVIGSADPAEGGWRVVETVRFDDFDGAGPLGDNATWDNWDGRRVEVLITQTEAHPSCVYWISWFLTADLAEQVFGYPET
jgi:hypothetical protein